MLKPCNWKRFWHPELKTAMKTQLVERYLRDNQCQCGLYVVGWFLCEYWKGKDRRRSQARRHFTSIEDCRKFLNDQAATLSASLSPKDGDVRTLVLDWTLS